MSAYDNKNRGSIWKNEKKELDTHPDFTGSLDVNGVQYWVNAWKRKEGAGERSPALTFSIRPKDQQSISQQAVAKIRKPDPISSGRPPFDDEVPFGPEFR
jgi:hypothetical protein